MGSAGAGMEVASSCWSLLREPHSRQGPVTARNSQQLTIRMAQSVMNRTYDVRMMKRCGQKRWGWGRVARGQTAMPVCTSVRCWLYDQEPRIATKQGGMAVAQTCQKGA